MLKKDTDEVEQANAGSWDYQRGEWIPRWRLQQHDHKATPQGQKR